MPSIEGNKNLPLSHQCLSVCVYLTIFSHFHQELNKNTQSGYHIFPNFSISITIVFLKGNFDCVMAIMILQSDILRELNRDPP
jgi:hypothetical protein